MEDSWTVRRFSCILFSMDQERFLQLVDEVRSCGDQAARAQGSVHRDYKLDGSVLTSIDLAISKRLIESIERLFPDSAIISEEHSTISSKGTGLTFIIDPIDGTDVYSQGFPSWCVAVGVLDRDRKPCAGIVYAPRWGLEQHEPLMLYTSDMSRVVLGNSPFSPKTAPTLTGQLVTCSTAAKQLDLSRYPGKIRSFGSNILHIISPVIYSHVEASLFSSCYVWDIAAAAAIIEASGLGIWYLDRSRLTFEGLLDRSLSSGYALVCRPEQREELLESIT